MTRLDALLRQVANEQDTLRADAGLRERLVVRVGRSASPRRGLRHAGRWSLAAAIAVVGGALAFALGPSTLEVKVSESGLRPAPGAWLDAPDRKSLSLEFSDGSRFDLAPTSKARLVELQQTGARVELANGSMRVHVVPRRGTDFRLDAGPFGVHVTGTRFELSYRPESDTFELFLEEGQVELSGCVFGQGRKLAAGQSVRASCTKQALDVSYGRPRREENERVLPRAPASETRLGAAAARSEENVRTGSDARPAASASSEKAQDPSWLALARAGEYREAFSIVHAQGFEAECERASSAALAQLADAARHAGAPKQAEHALLTLRRRFPGTADAALAAFALGRLEFDVYQAYPRAATWFKTYLSERPSGPMAREALGRLFEARYRAQDLVGARAGAARYLKEYPSGPHAELASRIVASP